MTTSSGGSQTELTYQTPKLHPKQRAFIKDASRFTWIEAGTKSGKTIGCIIWLHEQVLAGHPTQNFWWVAPYYTQAEIAFRRLWTFIPDAIKPSFAKNESKLTISYPGKGKVWFKSAEKPDALYGDDVHAMVIDEASRMREDSWNALRSTLTATIGRAKIIGNVKGRKNWFYRAARAAKAAGEGYHLLTSYDNPFLSKEEIDLARENLPESVFNELYMSVPTEDGANPFGMDHIRRAVQPQSKNPPVCFGIDLAKSVDFTVIIGLDAGGSICYVDRFQKDWQQTEQTIMNLPAVPTGIDSTGVGDPIVESLARKRQMVQGVKFTSTSKQQLMEGLASALQNGRLGITDGVVRDELDAFEFEHTRTGTRYSAPAGQHDDCVCALAIANSIFSSSLARGRYVIA